MLKLLDLIPSWLYAAAIAVLAAAFTWQTVVLKGTQTELRALQDDALARAAVNAEVGRIARQARDQAQDALSSQFSTIDQRTSNEKTALALRVRDLERELQHRPDRPAAAAGVPGGAAPALACTGAQLYRADAGFLAGEAARADSLRIQLADCRSRYDAAARMSADWHRLQQTLANTITPTPKGPAP